VKRRNMLTWMLWSAAACLSSPGHGHAIPAAQATLTASTFKAAPDIDVAVAAVGLILFLGCLALLRSGWTSRSGTRG
jgi:hypothetical protein